MDLTKKEEGDEIVVVNEFKNNTVKTFLQGGLLN